MSGFFSVILDPAPMKTPSFVLRPHETELRGWWTLIGGRMKPDEMCHRIERLTSSALKPLALSAAGGRALYEDPQDKRLWERIYPIDEMSGETPQRLVVTTLEAAVAQYPEPWNAASVERNAVVRRSEQLLADQLSFEDFLTGVPESPMDEDVSELIDLFEHEPARGGLFGVRAKEHDEYMTQIRQLVAKLRVLPASPD